MTYTNTQIAKQIASLLNKNKTPIFQKGNTSSTGINKEITVRLTTGKVVRALAWNVSTPGQVTVFWDAQNKRYIAWKESVSSLKRRTVLANRKTRPDDKKYLWEYFIKVLQPSSLEGFDADVALDLTGYTPLGITNLGNSYLTVSSNGTTYKILSDEIRTITPNSNNYIDGLPSFKYVGSDNFYFWRRITPTRSVDSFGGNVGGEGYFVPTSTNWARSFITPRTDPFAHSYKTPTNVSFLPNPGEVILYEPSAYNGSPFFIVFKYTLPDSETFLNFDVNATQTLSVDNSPYSASYNATWSGNYNEIDEDGSLEDTTTTTYNFTGSGGGSALITNTFEAITGYNDLIEYVESDASQSSNYSSSYTTPENINNYKHHEYDADHNETYEMKGYWFGEGGWGGYGDTIRIVNKREFYEFYETVPDINYQNDFITISQDIVTNKKYECVYTENYSNISLLPGLSGDEGFPGLYAFLTTTTKTCVTTTTISPENIILLKISIDNSQYSYGGYSNDLYTWSNSFFITSESIVENNTTNQLNIDDISVSFGSNYPFYIEKIKSEILTTGENREVETNIDGVVFSNISPIDETEYTYYTQTPFNPSGNVDIYVKQVTGLFLKYSSEISSETHSDNANLTGEILRNYLTITVTVEEPEDTTFINSESSVIIIPSNDYNEWVWYNIKNHINQCNIYKILNEQGVEVVELAIAEIPTTTTPTTLRADIYRFNTTTLKWERRPNAITPVSPLTEVSEFVSYHPTPSNSRKKRNQPPRF